MARSLQNLDHADIVTYGLHCVNHGLQINICILEGMVGGIFFVVLICELTPSHGRLEDLGKALGPSLRWGDR